jgi:HSP20 family protein
MVNRTTLTRYSPAGYGGLARLNQMLDQMFSSGEEAGPLTSAWFPAVDVMEDQDSVRVVAEIPGVRPEDIHVSLENNLLTLRGEKRQESERSSERVHRYERTYGSFERSFVLPSTVDPDRIEARYDAGVLTVTVPKAEQARPREIPIRTDAGQQEARGAERVKTRS